MQIIVLSGDGGKRLTFDESLLGWLLAVAILLAVVFAWLGFAWGTASTPPLRADRDYHHAVALLAQQDELNRAVAETVADLDVLRRRTATLEARTVRLDLMGKHVAALAGVDAAEFRFEQPAAVPAKRGANVCTGLERLSQLVLDREPKLAGLEHVLSMRRVHARTTPSGRPVRKGWISSLFGPRADPLTGRNAFHDGVDFAGRYKSPVIAVAAGVVTMAQRQRGYGNVVQIDHGFGLATRYAHNQKNLVKRGDTVAKGDIIALMGTTGRSTGAHVHFEVRHHGKAVDPRPFL